jgi:hypothetical protein
MTIAFVLLYTSFYDSFTVLVVDQLGTLRVGFTYFLFRAFHRPNHHHPHLYLHIITHTIHISSLLQQFSLPTSSLRSIQSYSHLNRDGLVAEQKIPVPIWIFECYRVIAKKYTLSAQEAVYISLIRHHWWGRSDIYYRWNRQSR